MRKNYFTILICLLLLSCEKNLNSINDSQVNPLYGKWRWTRSTGGIAGWMITPSANTKVILTYTSDGFYSQSRNDTLQQSSRFTVKKQKTIYSTDSLDVIVFQDTTIWRQVIRSLSPDTLRLGDNCYDGYVSEYRKVNES